MINKKTVFLSIVALALIYIWYVNVYCNEKSSTTKKSNTKYTLYYFYSPYCVYCKQFQPEWEFLKKQLSKNQSDKITLIEIDGSDSKNDHISFYYDIKGFPTIILATSNENIIYTGNRTANDMLDFVASKI